MFQTELKVSVWFLRWPFPTCRHQIVIVAVCCDAPVPTCWCVVSPMTSWHHDGARGAGLGETQGQAVRAVLCSAQCKYLTGEQFLMMDTRVPGVCAGQECKWPGRHDPMIQYRDHLITCPFSRTGPRSWHATDQSGLRCLGSAHWAQMRRWTILTLCILNNFKGKTHWINLVKYCHWSSV